MPDSELTTPIEGFDGIFVLRASSTTRGWNGIRYKTGLSAKNVKAKHLSMNVATIPPGGVAYAHIHVDFEVMLYILEGSVRNTGIHAAGIIIAPKDLTEIIPVATSKETELLITQFEGKVIEDSCVIKMDFLGLSLFGSGVLLLP